MREVSEIIKNPGFDDTSLVDLTSLPFVTIDNLGSKDLDQALFITKRASPAAFAVY